VHAVPIFGSTVFADVEPVFVGHQRLAGALAERGEFYHNMLAELLGSREAAGGYVMPSLLVADRVEIDLGNRVLELSAHPPAHTDNDLSVFDRRTATLWAADLLFVSRVPSLDGSLIGWIKAMEALRRLPASRAVPGHGPASVVWPDGAADQARYLGLLDTEIRAFLARSGDIEEAAATICQSERGRWKLYDEYNGHNVTVAFKELEWE
jgi:quinoprotein relay system zinc metallohydrolase 2